MPGTPPTRTTYLGPAGTFSEAALRTLPALGPSFPSASVADALAAVRSGEADAALVPFENSLEGSVGGTLDDLADLDADPLRITREVLLPVSFALLAPAGTTLGDVRVVATIGAAEAQCRRWLRERLPGVPVVPAASTAEAARRVAAGEVPGGAAVAARAAAASYGLQVLAEGLEDAPGAVTRFVLVARPGPPPPPTGGDRTSVVLYPRADSPGALLEVLTEFAVRGVNLTRLEPRPVGTGLGRYRFAVDLDGHLAEARVGDALAALHRLCAAVVFLGSYPRGDGAARAAARTGTTDADYRDAAGWLARLRDGG